jgi:hypothetical protein
MKMEIYIQIRPEFVGCNGLPPRMRLNIMCPSSVHSNVEVMPGSNSTAVLPLERAALDAGETLSNELDS